MQLNDSWKGAFDAPTTLPQWVVYLLLSDHVRSELSNDCPGCAACDGVRQAAHEAFFLLPPAMRDSLCDLCFSVDLAPIDVFGWEPDDFLRVVR
jgi:hypothetical protein